MMEKMELEKRITSLKKRTVARMDKLAAVRMDIGLIGGNKAEARRYTRTIQYLADVAEVLEEAEKQLGESG